MKKFFLKLFCFILIIIAIDLSYGAYCDHYRRNVKAGMTRLDNIAAYETTADVLIFGSSRARRHYDTRVFEDSLGMEAFNCGYNSMGIEFFLPRLRQILTRYTPRMIVYDIMPVFDIMKSTSKLVNLKRLKPFFNDPIARDAILSIDSLEWLKFHSATYRYHGELSEYAKDQTNKEKFYNGYAPLNGTLKIDFKPHTAMTLDKNKVRLLDTFIKECKRHDIELYFVISPYFSNDMGDQAEELRRLTSVYDIPVFDHFNEASYMNDSTLYWDASHLNSKGALMFSNMVVSEIISSRASRAAPSSGEKIHPEI